MNGTDRNGTEEHKETSHLERLMEEQDQHSTGNSQTEIDIEALVKELVCDLRAVDSSGRGHGHPDCLISRVNMPTRLVDPSEYDPYSVHIGPYHHDPLHWEEPAKRAVLRGLLPEMEEEERADKLRGCLTEIALLEGYARGCYANSTERMAREEFAQMLLLDGCYILHFFGFRVGDHSGASAKGSTTSNGIPNGGGTAPSQSRRALDYIAIARDVVYLLENQIPFLVLEKIHELLSLSHGESGRGTAVVDAAMDRIRWLLREQGYSTLDVASPRPCHLVHLLHMHFRPTRPSSPTINVNATGDRNLQQHRTGGPAVHRWRLATQYDIAGVKFERRDLVLDGQLARSVLDVELKGRTLRVPYLTVDNNTWRILRNLMALEQHSPQLRSDVTAYCLFMSQVAGTEKDVAFLAKKKIIEHLLGSDKDVAEGFEKLCRGVAIDLKDPTHNYLSETMEKLERQYNSRRNNWIAWLRRRHLANPWLVIALGAAIIGFACGVIQAVYSILGANKSH